MIVSIDEKEYLQLGMLFEQVFAGCRIQMVSSLINPANVSERTQSVPMALMWDLDASLDERSVAFGQAGHFDHCGKRGSLD